MADGGTISSSTLSAHKLGNIQKEVLSEVELPNTLADMCRLVRRGARALGKGARVHVCCAPPGQRGTAATFDDDIDGALGTVVRPSCAPHRWTPMARWSVVLDDASHPLARAATKKMADGRAMVTVGCELIYLASATSSSPT
jgi:hypothetical protein